MSRHPGTAILPALARADEREAARSDLTERDRRLLRPLLYISIVLLPLQIPRTGSNLAPADFALGAFTLFGLAVFWKSKTRIRLPLAWSYALIVVGGLIGTLSSIVLGDSLQALFQDAYLFAWFVVALNFIRLEGEGIARRVAGLWIGLGALVGIFLWVTRALFTDTTFALFGSVVVNEFGRAYGTFRDPNLAGVFVAVSLFVMWASPWPRRTIAKLVLSVPFLMGIYATESITALVILAGGTVIALVFGFAAWRKAAIATVLLLLAGLFTAITLLPDDFNQRQTEALRAIGSTKIFEDSLGRTDSSLGPRSERWRDAIQFFGDDVLFGIGPSATDDALSANNAPIGGELHNDFIAGFIERGVVGAVGVAALFLTASVWSVRAATDRRLRSWGWRPAAFIGVMVALIGSSMSLETLHFRHVWAFFALVIALSLISSEQEPLDQH